MVTEREPLTPFSLPLAQLTGFEMALRALDLRRTHPKPSLMPGDPAAEAEAEDDLDELWDNVPV